MKDTTAQEGLGPIFGKPVPMKLIIASKDLVAADAVTSNIMGYKPEEVKITRIAHERGLGEMDLDKIEVIGTQIADVQRRFERATEVKIEGLPPYTVIEDEKACTGCKATLVSALMDIGPASRIPPGRQDDRRRPCPGRQDPEGYQKRRPHPHGRLHASVLGLWHAGQRLPAEQRLDGTGYCR